MKRYLRCTAFILAFFILTLILPAGTWAAAVNILMAPPDPPVRGGDSVALELYLHNNTDAVISRQLPLRVPCRIDTGRTQRTVNADLSGGQAMSRVDIPEQGFARRQYRLNLPVYAMGTVHLKLLTLETNALTLSVEKPSSEAWRGEQVPLDEGPAMIQSFLDNFSVHEPMYFLLGVDPGIEQSKFQFSFKYRLFNPDGDLAAIAPMVSSLYLGYTQRSVWDLKSASQPFDDTSYMPEIFFELPKIDLNIDRITAFGLRAGFMHESNGKAGNESRSTNYVYLEPIMGIHLGGPFFLKIAPKIYTYVNNNDDTNADLKDYRGYFDLATEIIDPDGLALESHLWWADKGATLQLDLSYPMPRLLPLSLSLYLHAQYFSGYAETLLHYDQRQDVFRLGFSIVR
ncbi:phospholipase A [Desulfosarcina ovata]|uniref:phospholipase A n=1 Tax=Desulfosarcina ovata TaxID=83564 RepID=UPI0012D2E99E|nr:phospholipase A [Desulfosarcina ovata]